MTVGKGSEFLEGASPVGDAEIVAATEAWFRARGVPHLAEDYRATEDIFTRAAPVLILVFFLEMLGAASFGWRWWQNLLAVAGGLALLLGGWALVNRLRGRRPLSRPDTVGPVELAVFVLLPGLVPVVFGGQLGTAALTVAGNLVLLGLIYAVTSYGLIPLTRWALVRTVRELGAVAGLFARALPLLLLFATFLFINTEVWQVASALSGLRYWSAVGFFLVLGTVFLLARLPGEVRHLADGLDEDAVAEACAGTPVAGRAAGVSSVDVPPLTRRQRGNLLLVLLFSQGVQVALVTALIGVFFLAFGLIAIRPAVIDAWLGDLSSDVLVTFDAFGERVQLTTALLHVAGFLAGFSGLYFAVYAITDSTYRQQFFDEVLDDVRRALAVRAVYLTIGHRAGEGETGAR